MKKILTVITAVVLIYMMAGCMSFEAGAGMDDKGIVTISYDLIIPIDEMDETEMAKLFMLTMEIKTHWKSRNMKVTHDKDDEKITLSGVYTEEFKNAAQAFEGLEKLLKDSEISMFEEVTANYEKGWWQEEYSLSVKADFSKLIDMQELDDMPYFMEERIKKAMEKSTVTVNLSLPGEIISSEGELSSKDGINTVSVTVAYNQVVSLGLHTHIDNTANQQEFTDQTIRREELTAHLAEMDKFTLYAGIAAIVLILAMLILTIIAIMRMKKHKKAKKLLADNEEISEYQPGNDDLIKAEEKTAGVDDASGDEEETQYTIDE